MTTVERPQALVIGGSLGGLFSAICLRAIGWRVRIFERSPQALDSRGGGLVLQPAVEQALAFAGLPRKEAFGVPSRDRIFIARDGSCRSVPMPQEQIAWNGLYQRMRQAIDPAMLHAGETLVSFWQHGNRVQARFASGLVADGDLLVGADGPLSTVRAALLPGASPVYAGYAAWRGVLPERDMSQSSRNFLRDTFAFQNGAGHQFLTYLIPGEDGSVLPGARRQNWVWYRPMRAGPALEAVLQDRSGRRHSHSLPPGAMGDSQVAMLREAAGDMLAPVLAELVTSTPDPFLQLIYDYEAPRMVFGRVALLGDAAFVARPHTGAGAGKAAADALSLARALQDDTDVDAALHRYEAGQLAGNRNLVRLGIALGRRIMGTDQPGWIPAANGTAVFNAAGKP